MRAARPPCRLTGTLGLGIRAGEAETVAAIKKDARDMPGENSYQVDIGV